MINFNTNKCPKCGKLAEIIPSNNPLVPGICGKCISKELDPSSIKQADFFCRTYNIPFDPNKWLNLFEKCGEKTFVEYVKQFFETDKNNLYYQKVTADLWGQLDEEWQRCTTFEELLTKVEKVKDSFIARNQIKWGPNYTFEEYVQLENLLISTLRANDISNPLQIDAIKKACKISVELDKAIKDGDSKGIKDLSSAYSGFTKTAQIDAVIATANNDVITTVADLADYIEKCGGQYHYYDGVERDIVDKTINDLKEYLRVLVQDSTGLGATLEQISQAYRNSLEQNAAEEATSKTSIEDIIKDQTAAANREFDEELANETLEDIVIGDEEDEYFG